MRELKYFNICYSKNIDRLFYENISTFSNDFFHFETHEELINLINTKNIHLLITKYNYELLKNIKLINDEIQIIAILDEINHTHLLESLNIKNIKLVAENLSCLNEFIDILKDCIKTIDSKKSNIINLKNEFIYDTYNKTLFRKNSIIVSLTKKEVLFFDFLVKNSNRALSYEEINEKIWDGAMTQDALRSLIKEIRRKTYKELIKNVSGIGYRLDI